MSRADGYVGRFAPSPTGALHFGSALAAIGSWLDARRAGGRWLLRIDDLDTPRNALGAADTILRDLERLGLEWDGAVHYQSRDTEPYADAVERLRAAGLAFGCGCSRQDLVDGVYPGTCRGGVPSGRRERAVRLRVDDRPRSLDDLVQGRFTQRLESTVGDVVVRRADGIVAYHLATVIDDAAAGVSHVVRGADLLDSTPRQTALQDALGLPRPRYAHLPIASNRRGQKLSKQTHAPPVSALDRIAVWRHALDFLGHPPPPQVLSAGLDALREWALAGWDLARVPARSLAEPLPEAAVGAER